MQNNVDVIIAMLLRGREFKMLGKGYKRKGPAREWKRLPFHNTENGNASLAVQISEVPSLSNSSRGCWLYCVDSAVDVDLAVRLCGSAITRDVACLATLVTNFPSGVKWPTVRGGAVARDVALRRSG